MKTARAKASWLEEKGVRLDAAYHLSEGRQAQITIDNHGNYESLANVTQRIFLGGRFRRTYVADSERGYPYLTASDMIKSEPVSGEFLSKVHTGRIDKLKIEKDWILVSCSGSIGRTVYTNSIFEGQIGTHDLIRIVPNQAKMPGGYVYAFLTSKYGYSLLTQGTYGGVIQHIEPHHIFDLPVPRLPAPQMQRISEAIQQATKRREEASAAMRGAIKLLENLLPRLVYTNKYVTPVSAFKQRLRFDATIQQAAYGQFLAEAAKNATLKTIGSVSSQVFTPNIFKRIRVAAKNGVPFLSGTDLLENRPALTSFLSRRTHRLNDYILQKDWLAIQDSGSLSSMGYVSIVPEFLAGAAATNNLIRVIPGEKNYNPYFFAYLKTKQGQQILKSLSYGTGQLHIDNGQIQQLEVPIYEDVFDEVTELVAAYTRQFNEAYKLETQAIHEVESVISAWQK